MQLSKIALNQQDEPASFLPMVETTHKNTRYPNFGSKVAAAMRREGVSVMDIKQALNVSYEMARRYSLGEAKPRDDRMRKLAGLLKESPASLQFDEDGSTQSPSTGGSVQVLEWESADDLPEGQFVLVPRFDVKISAGNGRATYDAQEKDQPQAFRADWVRKLGLRKKGLMVVYANGDSMAPRINDGDALLVDRTQTDIVDGKVYALRYGSDLRVKRLSKRFDGGLLIRSDNSKDYPDEAVRPEEMQHIEVIGRVVHVSGEV